MIKKKWISLSILLLILTVVITYFGVIKPTPMTPIKQEKVITSNDLRIAFVNEDNGITYNEELINIGGVVTNSFVKRHGYQIESVTRAIAESGLNNGHYQLMVILPSKFSESALALESVHPQPAIFQYKIKTDQQLLLKQAEQVVSELKTEFNKDIIHIYFSSIIGNLQTAQNQVADVVDNEHQTLVTYQNNLLQPVTNFSQQFTNISQSSNSLLGAYSGFNKEFNQTGEAFNSILSVDKSYDKELDLVKTTQDMWQKSMMDKESQLLKYDENLSQLSIDTQLKSLTETQSLITTQFNQPLIWQDISEKSKNLNDQIDGLATMFTEMNRHLDETTEAYATRLSEAVKASLKNQDLTSETMNTDTLSYLSQDLKDTMLNKINQAIEKVPYYSSDVIDQMKLSNQDKQYLKNINAFIEWYIHQYNQDNLNLLVNAHTISYQNEHFEKAKQFVNERLLAAKTMIVDSREGVPQQVVVQTDDGYIFDSVTINGQSAVINGSIASYEGTLNKGAVTIVYTLKPASPNDINLLTPVHVQATVQTTEEINIAKAQTVTETKTIPLVSEQPKVEVTSEETNELEKESATTISTDKQVIEAEKQPFIRTFSQSQVELPYQYYTETQEGQSVAQDLLDYATLSGVVYTVFDIDLMNTTNFESSENSLIAKANLNHLENIIVKLVTETSIDQLKTELTISDDKIQALTSVKAQSETLEETANQVQQSTNDLIKQLEGLVTETTAISKVLAEKPKLEISEKQDNTDLVTVSMSMNNDLQKLMTASQSLLNNTKANQTTADTLKSSFENLNDTVKGLEDNGTGLSSKIDDLKSVMDKNYSNHEEFLKAFSSVLSNTKIGNKKNQEVFNYLANPVDGTSIDKLLIAHQKQTTMARQDTRSSFMIILISYLLSLVVANLMQNIDLSSMRQRRLIARVQWKNMILPLAILSMMSVLLGIVTANIIGLKLEMATDQLIQFNLIMISVFLLFIFIHNWLFMQLKNLGMIISIGVCLLYIITTTQLFDVQYVAKTSILNYISPLNYIDKMLTSFINHQDGDSIIVLVIIILVIITGVINALKYREIK